MATLGRAQVLVATLASTLGGCTATLVAGDDRDATAGADVSAWDAPARDGQPGDSAATDTAPGDASTDPFFRARMVRVGQAHVCAVGTDGYAYCWGGNTFGGVGDGTVVTRGTPVRLAGLGPVEEVATGTYHSCARTTAGEVWCWGGNSMGQVGNGQDSQTSVRTPTRVPGISDAAGLAIGSSHSCVLTRSGVVRCWGGDRFGQAGQGSTTDWRPQPVAVPLPPGTVRIFAASSTTCAIDGNDGASCWGALGGVGSGVPGSTANATAVPGTWRQFAISADDVCARAVDGHIECAGQNGAGELGDGTMTPRYRLAALGMLSSGDEVGAGDSYICVRDAVGDVRCMGRNWSGQLGNGTMHGATSPVEVTGVHGATQLAVGATSACVVFADQSVRCWGNDRLVPLQIVR